jgi:PAS domain S-box-containing protein
MEIKIRIFFRAVQPFTSALAVMATAAALVFAIYYSELGPQWLTFLAGILVAAILADATRASRAEFIVMRRTAQLAAVKTKLERETQLRMAAEKSVASSKSRLHLIDNVLPTMVVFVDIEGHCQYYNRAFLDWSRLRREQIIGRHMRDVLGAKVYQETATATRQSLDGHAVHYERTQKMPDGAVYKLSVEHLPQFGEDGKATGFYMLINDVTEPGDVRTPAQPDSSAHQDMFVDSYSEQITGQQDAGRIRMAIENGEFSLFCQLITSLSITPLAVNSGGAEHYEILVRLKEEEEELIPPGRFFPLAEKYGLMTHLDRWVVQHVAEWVSRQNSNGGGRKNTVLFINVSGATIADPGFPEFLQLTLLEHGVPGTALCFEIPDSELALKTAEVAEFARQVRQCGCYIALSGFGRDRVLFDLIRGFQVEFLKIDGSVILDILHDPVKLAKVKAISQVAKKIGVKTVAEMVENEETIAKLREIGIDFAQGFGISRPRPLAG